MASKRQTLVTAIVARLQAITVANGYRTNGGANVYEWDRRPWNELKVPGFGVRDVERLEEPKLSNVLEHALNLEIDCVAAGASGHTIVRDMLADVEQAVGTDPTFGGVALTSLQVGDRMGRDTADTSVMEATMRINVRYRTAYWNPVS
jgi:hypothetical protein